MRVAWLVYVKQYHIYHCAVLNPDKIFFDEAHREMNSIDVGFVRFHLFWQVVATAWGRIFLDCKHGIHCRVPLVLLPFNKPCRSGRKLSWDFGGAHRVVHLGIYPHCSLPAELCTWLGCWSGPDITRSMVLLHCIYTLWPSHAHRLHG